MRRAPFRTATVAGAAALALLVAACGGTSDEIAQPTRTLPPPGSALLTTTTVGAPTPCPVAPIEVEGGKPPVEVPEGDPPTELVTEDLVVGEGAEAATGDTVAMQYVGVAKSTGTEFDASWDRGEPFTFTLGAGEVIPGWDQGIVGMKVGGRRVLVIPPDLGYGEQGAGEDIGPNETLVFVVDLVEVCSPATAAATPPDTSPAAAETEAGTTSTTAADEG